MLGGVEQSENSGHFRHPTRFKIPFWCLTDWTFLFGNALRLTHQCTHTIKAFFLALQALVTIVHFVLPRAVTILYVMGVYLQPFSQLGWPVACSQPYSMIYKKNVPLHPVWVCGKLRLACDLWYFLQNDSKSHTPALWRINKLFLKGTQDINTDVSLVKVQENQEGKKERKKERWQDKIKH